MQSVGKRTLSLISAIVMIMTLLPSALFANAAGAISVDFSSPVTQNNASFYDNNTVLQFENQEWSSATFNLNVSEAGEYKATVKYAGGGSAYFKVGLDTNEDLYGEGKWLNGSDDWGTPSKTKSTNVTLTSGTHTVTFGGQQYAKYAGFTLEKIGESTGGDSSSESSSEIQQPVDPAVADGFRVSGKKILDANGNEFIMRGINIGHAWLHPTNNTKPYSNDTFKAIKASAKLGVNTIRFCLSDGDNRQDMSEDWIETPREEVLEIIDTCEDNNVVAVLTIQDPTGNTGTWMIDNAVKYWISIRDILNAHKDTVILNIANEWNGSMGYYCTAIKRIRDAGIGNMIMVDAGDWGHGVGTITGNAGSIAGADKLNNTIFSIHAYKDIGNVRDAVYNCNQISQPIVVGEFGDDPNATMDCCEEWGIGYLAWSWIGNDGGVEYLDMAKDDDALELHSYGSNIFNRATGIQNTSKLCSVYTNKANPVVTTAVADGQSDMGTVSASTTVKLGDFTTVTATEKAGNHFEYWSIDGKKVSKSATYKFRPSKNTKIVANFASGESSTKTLILSSDSSMSYNDMDTVNHVVPFIVNADHGDIKVKITSGAGQWTNIFTDQGRISVSPSNGTEGKGSSGYTSKNPNFNPGIYSYCENNDEYTISSSSPAGIYYVGVSGSSNITIEITYENDDVSKYGSTEEPDPPTPTEPKYIVTLQASDSKNGTINGETFEKKNFNPGDTLTFPNATANSGYKFLGYSDGEKKLYKPGDVYTFKDIDEGEGDQKIKFTAVFEKTLNEYRDLPVVSVTTKDSYVENDDKEKSVDAWISTYNTDLAGMNLAGISANGGELRGRGNSTWGLDKKPYRLKFGKKTSLLTNTTDSNKKWVLLADYADRTLLRNKTVFDLAAKLNNIPFATKTQSVELYINGEYRGVYLVAQQTEDKDGRAGIGAIEDDGDYDANFTATDDELKFLAELDAGAKDSNEELYCDAYYANGKHKYYVFKSGAAKNPNGPFNQTDSNNVYIKRIKQYLDDVNAAIESKNESRIRQYIDVPSFVDMYLLQEIADNADVGAGSFYLSKYSDGKYDNKLTASPPWDFDRAFGNDQRGLDYNKLYVAKGEYDSDGSNVSKWYIDLCSQDWFVKEIEKRFTQLEDDGAFDELIDKNTYEKWKTSAAFNKNFEKWPVQNTSTGLWGEVPTQGSLDKSIDYMVDWIQNRFKKLHNTYYKADMKENYTITVKSADETMGTVSKTYLGNNKYTVTATPKSGYKFTGWTSNTNLSSSDAVYTFTASSDVILTAHFEIKGIEPAVYGNTLRLEAESAKIFSDDVFTVQSDIDRNFGGATSPVDKPEWLKSNADKNSGRGEAYIPFTIPATAGNTTYNFSMCYANSGDTRSTKLSVYKLDSNGNVTINGNRYSLVKSSEDLGNQGKVFSDGASQVISNVSLEAGQTYYIGMYGANWASFDYVDIKANSGNPFIVEDGCDFTFTDQFGNTLAKNSAKPVEQNGQMYYSPVAPANAVAQGYYLSAWEYTTENGQKQTIKVTEDKNNPTDAPSYVNAELEKLTFPSGSKVEFKAVYSVKGEQKTVTVKDGSIYTKRNADDNAYSYEQRSKSIVFREFDVIRLQAQKPEQGEQFNCWTLNGMIYSYDESIKYSVWADSNFEAHFSTSQVTKTPVAYVGEDIAFTKSNSNKYKMSMFTEFYVPSGINVIERGIVYSANGGKSNIESLNNGNLNSGVLTAPASCAKLLATQENIANNEVFMALNGLAVGKSYYARAYITYQENGQIKVVYSDYMAYVENVNENIDSVNKGIRELKKQNF